MVTVGEISTWHSVIVGTISIFLNSLLLFTICSRSLKVVGAYKYMMLATATLDLLFSMVDILSLQFSMGQRMIGNTFIIMLIVYQVRMAVEYEHGDLAENPGHLAHAAGSAPQSNHRCGMASAGRHRRRDRSLACLNRFFSLIRTACLFVS
ncbi:unnamed protein product [Haemonchus placei]|uniref:G_PROTEIN_RECEP_F1_2 domain-containing protein n=1 Tax=Haemonchus placei TaxID=6290 RepID=A0A0N4WS93_HAEPC|nr:unnamed protein product [Haemonchus placei]